jgi:uncharacterized membrane protein YfcA
MSDGRFHLAERLALGIGHLAGAPVGGFLLLWLSVLSTAAFKEHDLVALLIYLLLWELWARGARCAGGKDGET